MENQSDYLKYRGKCKEFVDNAIAIDSSLRAVRGYYHCPMWGKQAHWWCEKPDGSIFDPTAKQFPFGGEVGDYEEFDGWIVCNECGKSVEESEAKFESRYAFCSTKCIMRFVGL
jgi:hypothetical protein